MNAPRTLFRATFGSAIFSPIPAESDQTAISIHLPNLGLLPAEWGAQALKVLTVLAAPAH